MDVSIITGMEPWERSAVAMMYAVAMIRWYPKYIMATAYKAVDVMGVRVAGRGARERGDRRKEVEVEPKRRSLGHDVSKLVLETVEESCAFGEDRVLVGLR